MQGFLKLRALRGVFMGILGIAVLSGCATQIFDVGGSGGLPSSNTSHMFMLNGIFQSQEINASNNCGGPSGVAQVQFEEAIVDVLMNYFSSGLITPRSVRVYCKS